MTQFKKLIASALAVMTLAIVDVTAIVVLTVYKQSGVTDSTGNTTISSFITGLTYFATFMGVLVIAIVGKAVFSIFTGGGNSSL